MSGQVVRWVGLSGFIYDGEVIFLNLENPSFDSRWGFAMRIVEDGHQRFVISNHFERVAIEVEVKMLSAPSYCQGGPLSLFVSIAAPRV